MSYLLKHVFSNVMYLLGYGAGCISWFVSQIPDIRSVLEPCSGKSLFVLVHVCFTFAVSVHVCRSVLIPAGECSVCLIVIGCIFAVIGPETALRTPFLKRVNLAALQRRPIGEQVVSIQI